MRIVSNANFAMAKVRYLKQVKERAAERSGSNENSLLNKVLKKRTAATGENGSSIKPSDTQLKKDYTAIKNAADSLQIHAGKLLAAGESDLTKNKDTMIKEINSFIEDYNSMVGKMSDVGDTVSSLYLKKLKSCVLESRQALNELGITQASDGTLSVNKNTLKSADTEKMKQLFGVKDCFAAKVSDKSKEVETNSDANLSYLNKGSRSNYNRYGSLNNNSESSGKFYDIKG